MCDKEKQLTDHDYDMRIVAQAYGWLWHVITSDRRIHTARRLLKMLLTKDMMAAGINEAKKESADVWPEQ